MPLTPSTHALCTHCQKSHQMAGWTLCYSCASDWLQSKKPQPKLPDFEDRAVAEQN